MLNGTLALLERSLRMDARKLGPHLGRFCLMSLAYIAVIITFQSASMLGAPGLYFFRTVAFVNLTFMTLLGAAFFSTAITEEKEDESLGLILMADVSPLSILLGIASGRLVQALLLLAVQYPFALLAITFGGITSTQVRSAYAAQLAYALMLAGTGVLCSTVCRRNRSASTAMILVIIGYWLVPLACNSILARSLSLSPSVEVVLNSVAASCIFTQMGRILTTGLHQPLVSAQVVSNITIGILGFVVAWVLFGAFNRNPASEPTTRGLVSCPRGSMRWLSAGTLRFNPLAWKDFHFVGGGKSGILVRLTIYPSILLVATLYSRGFIGGIMAIGTPKGITAAYLLFTMIALAIDAGMLVSRSICEETRAQTFAALKLLPSTTGSILYSKLFGSLAVLTPGAACLFFGIFRLPFGPECLVDFLSDFPLSSFFVAHLILIPHAAAVFATFFRWGSLPLAICFAICSLVLTFSLLVAIQAARYGFEMPSVTLAVIAVCAFCHFAVWQRVEILATR